MDESYKGGKSHSLRTFLRGHLSRKKPRGAPASSPEAPLTVSVGKAFAVLALSARKHQHVRVGRRRQGEGEGNFSEDNAFPPVGGGVKVSSRHTLLPPRMNGGGTAIGGWRSDARVEEDAEFSAVSVLTRSLASLDAYGKESDHQRDGSSQKEQLIISKGDDVENWDWVGRPKRQIVDPEDIEVKGSIPEEFKTYSGERQSPISIQTKKTTPWRFPPLQWHHHWNRQSSIKLTNTGHSVQMSFGTDTKINGQFGTMPYLTGGPLAAEYEFVQMHFHWGCKDHLGCEHIIDDKSYAMEAHLVHYNKSYGSVEEAFKHGDGLAVIGIFMQVAESDNIDLNMLVSRIQEVCSEKDNCTTIEEQRPLLWVKEAVQAHSAKSVSGSGGYYTYLGSLTTPDYNENVTWILFPDPVFVSRRQIAEFRQLMSPKGKVVENYRELQPIADRTIFHAE